jgi:hypothetical protein
MTLVRRDARTSSIEAGAESHFEQLSIVQVMKRDDENKNELGEVPVQEIVPESNAQTRRIMNTTTVPATLPSSKAEEPDISGSGKYEVYYLLILVLLVYSAH